MAAWRRSILSGPERRRRAATRRGSVVIVVLWAIAIAALISSSIQLFAYRQATLGREVLHRTQARWAARAGIENSIAIMTVHTEMPIPDDGWAMINDLEFVSTYDELHDTGYDIYYQADGQNLGGPLDEHARLNINAGDLQALEVLEDMTPDVAASIRDWLDPDDDPGMLGAESDWYLGQHDYEPRNGPMRSIAEMELIAGIWGEYLRGEDWNLNNRLDSNENDADRAPPEDQPDDYLEGGWGGRLTVHSVDGGATMSGLPRLYLRRAEPAELMDRCGLSAAQAEALIEFGQNDQNTLEQLITTQLGGAATGGPGDGPGGGGGGSRGGGSGGGSAGAGDSGTGTDDGTGVVEPLENEQLRAILAETSVRPLYVRAPGKLNVNTASEFLIRDLLEVKGIDPAMADELIYIRNSRPEGINSILDLYDVPEMTPELLQQLAGFLTTSGNVYTITARGRSRVSGLEVEIIAVVDRSTVPVRILEYREQ